VPDSLLAVVDKEPVAVPEKVQDLVRAQDPGKALAALAQAVARHHHHHHQKENSICQTRYML
jgi:Na+-transporting methylmalonyl-CoA/oxaloacetate decarboxylase gamma subunit